MVRSDGSIGVHASGVLAADSDVKELSAAGEKLIGSGATLVYLDLVGCTLVDSRIISPIVRLQKQLEQGGCRFEVRVSDERLLSFFREIELDKIVTIRELNTESMNNHSTNHVAS